MSSPTPLPPPQDAQPSEVDLYRFSRDAMHELRTALAGVHGFTSLLEDGLAGELNPMQREYVQHAQHGADRLLRGLESFMDGLRLRLGEWREEPRRMHLDEVLGEVLPPGIAVPREAESIELEGVPAQLVRALTLVAQHAGTGPVRPPYVRLQPAAVELLFPADRTPRDLERHVLERGHVSDELHGCRTVERICGLDCGLARGLIVALGGELEWCVLEGAPALRVRLPRSDAGGRELDQRPSPSGPGGGGGSSSGTSKSWRRYTQRPSSPSHTK